MTDDEHFERILVNAERLWSDSKLLNANNRAKSAIILAVFALEELGKALITDWGVKNLASKREHPTHVEKQSATFALLCANEMLKKKSQAYAETHRARNAELSQNRSVFPSVRLGEEGFLR